MKLCLWKNENFWVHILFLAILKEKFCETRFWGQNGYSNLNNKNLAVYEGRRKSSKEVSILKEASSLNGSFTVRLNYGVGN